MKRKFTKLIFTLALTLMSINSFAQYYGYTYQDIQNMAARQGVDLQALTNNVYQMVYDNMMRQQNAYNQFQEQFNKFVMPQVLQQVQEQMQNEYNMYRSFYPNATMSDFIDAKNMAAYEIQHGKTPSDSYFSSNSSSGSGGSYNYRESYQRWENNARRIVESMTTGGYTDSQGGHANLNDLPAGGYNQYQQLLKNSQAEMRKTRAEASRNGISIPQSSWETYIVDCYK